MFARASDEVAWAAGNADDLANKAMTDTELLDKLEKYLEPKRLGCETLSLKINVRYAKKVRGMMIRMGGEPGHLTLRSAIEELTRNVQ